MTDRYDGFVVILDKNLRSDDAQSTLNAIKQIKGVVKVKPLVSDVSVLIAQQRVRTELIAKLYEVLEDKE